MSDPSPNQTAKDQRRARYRDVQRLWREASSAIERHREAMEEARGRERNLRSELLTLEDEFRDEEDQHVS